ncbi:hypothetical protein DFH09DRAFT_1246596 [Mycena vulgaris]|nr:hypothetical protein DFH09DRAFT_1246596 [Mycena vulgaris]
MSFLQREELLVDSAMPEVQYDNNFNLDVDSGSDDGWEDKNMDAEDERGFETLPPGEEGLLQSHAGGEAIFQRIWEKAKPGANETLLFHGFIGGSPDQPTIAFSIKTFEVYRQIHRVCPRFSIDGLAKVLNYLHMAPRKAYLAEQLTTTYDAYLAILRSVDGRVQAALGRDEDWKAKNICPPCFYKVTGCMDGNNSLKLVDSTFLAGQSRFDNRKTESFRWLTAAVVDIFKDEVKTAPKLNDAESDELEKCVNTCVERWKNAGPEAQKKMFALFAIAGIFIAVCRHGHVLVMCDMIRSGELMKYPLAIVKRLLDLYGAELGLGYDIMCAFFKTLLRSSLGCRVVAVRMRGVVPAWHGHAHNRGCQVDWHPLYVEGVGLEDFEECERTFCQSNNLATVTRLSTPFHRQQQIDEHFNFHDLDKYASSGKFIFQNYRQATEKIALNSVMLEALELQLHTTAEDYELYLVQERAHLDRLKREPPDTLWTVESTSVAAAHDFRNLDYHITRDGWTGPKIQSVRAKYRTTYTRCVMLEEQLSRHEVEHGIAERWVPTMKEYKDALEMMTQRRYRIALDELERLVVQRLLEMTKLGASGVAYKLREKIGRALHTRAPAVRHALSEYNAAAILLHPPRDQVTWAEVANLASVAEFDLLKDTRTDIRTLPWAEPARREAMVLYFGIKRAKEEIQRLDVEITRLLTFMIDDHVDYFKAITACISAPTNNLGLAHELSTQWRYRANINAGVVERLVKVVIEHEEGNDAEDTERELHDVDSDLLDEVMSSLQLG